MKHFLKNPFLPDSDLKEIIVGAAAEPFINDFNALVIKTIVGDSEKALHQVKLAYDEYGIHHVPYHYLCGGINALDDKLLYLLHLVRDVVTSSRHQITFGSLVIYRLSQQLHT